MILTPSEWARHKGFSRQYAAKLIKQGTIRLTSGKVDTVRAECLKVRKQPYIVAAVTQGHAPLKILFSHVLPNALVAAFTFLPFQMTGAIETLAVLDLLGFGLPPGSPSLGEMPCCRC
jgi:ABC-type microcin C transport system permease subunit YejE